MAISRLQQSRQMRRGGGIMGSNAGSMLVANTADGSRPGYGGPHDSIGDKNTSSKSGSGAQREGNNNRFEMAYNPPPPSIGTGGEGRDGRFNLTPKEKKDLSKAINLSQRTGSYVPSLGMYKPKNFVRNIFDKSIYGRVLAPFVKMDNNLRKKRKKYLEGKYDVNMQERVQMAANGGLMGLYNRGR